MCGVGVLNVVHGAHATVNQICDHEGIRAVAFVGSDVGGRHVYTRACAAGKRVQSNMGAKNHAVVLPDADLDQAVAALTGAAFGAAGQRCMAISAAVLVGDARAAETALVATARKLTVRCKVASAALRWGCFVELVLWSCGRARCRWGLETARAPRWAL
jgi:malonate-semialdehyde dehydrogenase (acetylating) / methylmalonate-semialdehyde dehydrogenase